MSAPTRHVGVNAVGAVMGGAARHLSPFLAALGDVRPGWTLTVWAHESADLVASDRVTVIRVPRQRVPDRLRWENLALRRELGDAGCDVLVNLTNSAPLRVAMPSVLYQRNSLWFDRAWLARLDRRQRAEAAARRALTFIQARGAEVVVVPSSAMADLLRSWRGWPRATAVRVVPHGVDVDRFTFRPRPWPPPDGTLRLLSVGHQAPHKDQALLADLVHELRGQGDAGGPAIDARLTVTIDRDAADPATRALVRRVSDLGIEDVVDFAGSSSAVETLYAAADVTVSPSITESFGFPLLEAMSSGTPTIATRIPASVEVLGGNGWFFPVGDARAAASEIRAMLALDPAVMADRLGAAVEAARAYTWEANARGLAAVVDEVCEPAGRAG